MLWSANGLAFWEINSTRGPSAPIAEWRVVSLGVCCDCPLHAHPREVSVMRTIHGVGRLEMPLPTT